MFFSSFNCVSFICSSQRFRQPESQYRADVMSKMDGVLKNMVDKIVTLDRGKIHHKDTRDWIYFTNCDATNSTFFKKSRVLKNVLKTWHSLPCILYILVTIQTTSPPFAYILLVQQSTNRNKAKQAKKPNTSFFTLIASCSA